MAEKKTKILIVNGGGALGAIAARFLAYVSKQDEETRIKDLDGVDVISGCSIGGILAVAYASGKDFKFIDQTFQARAKECFDRTAVSYVNPLCNHKYKNESLDAVINDMVGETSLGQVRKIYPNLKVIVPCLNLTDDKYKVFDNFGRDDAEVKLSIIAGLTSAAPTYFACRNYQGKCIVDGGIIECNPLLTTITALKGKLGMEFKDMDVLMLGAGQDVSPKTMTIERYNSLGLLGIATEVISPYVTLSNTMVTEYWGKNLGLNRFIYWNPVHTTGELDDTDQIPELIKSCDCFKDEFIAVWNKWLYDVE